MKAISSPFGQKVKEFYTTTEKQLRDIHEEARRIAETHKGASSATTAAASGQPGAEGHPASAPAAAPAPGAAPQSEPTSAPKT